MALEQLKGIDCYRFAQALYVVASLGLSSFTVSQNQLTRTCVRHGIFIFVFYVF